MTKNNRHILIFISVLCGISAAYFAYKFTDPIFPLFGTKYSTVGYRILIVSMTAALTATLFVLPVYMSQRHPRLFRFVAFASAMILFGISYVTSFIALSDAVFFLYSADRYSRLFPFLCSVVMMLGAITGGIILFLAIRKKKLPTVTSRGPALRAGP